MTRRFLHNTPWSSLLDAWSEVHPRLRYTIHVRDDRPPFKQAARSAPLNSAVASAACLEGRPGPVTPSTGPRHSPFRSVNADSAAAPDSQLLARAPARKIKQLPLARLIRGSLSCYACAIEWSNESPPDSHTPPAVRSHCQFHRRAGAGQRQRRPQAAAAAGQSQRSQARRKGAIRPQDPAGGDADARGRVLRQRLHSGGGGAADRWRVLAGDAVVAQSQLGASQNGRAAGAVGGQGT